MVHLELGWDAYEPSDGTFSSSYATAMRERVRDMKAAGLKVVLGAGLQYPPSWAYSVPGSRYVNQFGRSSGELNLTFNAALRERASRYLAQIDKDLGLENFWAVRVGAGGNIETLYPAHDADGTNRNAYWAFDAAAQATSPFPGWRPGDRSWNGVAMTTADVRRWYEWYVGSLADTVEWQLQTYRALGFEGHLHVLMPGQGTRPLDLERAMGAYLDGTGDGSHTTSRGAAWHRVLEHIEDRRGVVAYVSSMADGSGWDDLCRSTDSGTALSASEISLWSATRWISFLADRYGLPKNGENPGRADTSAYGTTMMERAAAQMASCGFQGMMWAHESQLFTEGSGVTLEDYRRIIDRY